MLLSQLIAAFRLSFKQLMRNRTAIILLFVIPTVFFAITVLTTKNTPTAFKLASVRADLLIQISQRRESLMFMALSAIGLLAAFLGLESLNRDRAAVQRLVISGYRPATLIFGKLALLLVVIAAVSAYVLAFLSGFFRPENWFRSFAGLCLLAYVYGAFGMLIGAVVKRQLEGILLIALLVNIDVGWLQNPLFYADALNQVIIRYLPAFYPVQVSMIGAFTKVSVMKPALPGLLYGSVFLVLSLAAYWLRVRSRS